MGSRSDTPLNRRDFLILAGATLGAVACKDAAPPANCTDVASLDERRKKVRESLAYAEPSADPARRCDACVQWEPGPDGECGKCKLDIGPVSPAGTCSAFGKKA